MTPSPQPECRTHVNRPVCSANILGAYLVPWPGKQPRMQGGVRWSPDVEEGIQRRVTNKFQTTAGARARPTPGGQEGCSVDGEGDPASSDRGRGAAGRHLLNAYPGDRACAECFAYMQCSNSYGPTIQTGSPRAGLVTAPKSKWPEWGSAWGVPSALTLTATVNSEDLRVLKKLETSAGQLWPSQCFSGFHAQTYPFKPSFLRNVCLHTFTIVTCRPATGLRSCLQGRGARSKASEWLLTPADTQTSMKQMEVCLFTKFP